MGLREGMYGPHEVRAVNRVAHGDGQRDLEQAGLLDEEAEGLADGLGGEGDAQGLDGVAGEGRRGRGRARDAAQVLVDQR